MRPTYAETETALSAIKSTKLISIPNFLPPDLQAFRLSMLFSLFCSLLEYEIKLIYKLTKGFGWKITKFFINKKFFFYRIQKRVKWRGREENKTMLHPLAFLRSRFFLCVFQTNGVSSWLTDLCQGRILQCTKEKRKTKHKTRKRNLSKNLFWGSINKWKYREEMKKNFIKWNSAWDKPTAVGPPAEMLNVIIILFFCILLWRVALVPLALWFRFDVAALII